MRLDEALSKLNKNISRSKLRTLIKQGFVKVDGRLITKPSFSVNEASRFFYKIPDTKQVKLPKSLIIFEDDDCVVINKPTGILTHAKGSFSIERTVASMVSTYLSTEFDNPRKHIVHRLDRGTSGIMICSKNKRAHEHFQRQFRLKKTKKEYVATCTGSTKVDQAVIDIPIKRDPKHPIKYKVSSGGKQSQTRYIVLRRFNYGNNKFTLIKLTPITGRTHQIRVHLNYVGLRIVGDQLYGGIIADRVYLHSKKLTIKLMNSETKTFATSVPKKFYKPIID